MLHSKFFTRQYLNSFAVVITFILLAYLLNGLFMRFNTSRMEMMGGNPGVFFAKLMDHLNEKDHVKALKEIESIKDGDLPFNFGILDAAGKALYPADLKIKFDWNKIHHPLNRYEVVTVDHPEHHPPPPMGMGPGPGGPPPGMVGENIVLLGGSPLEYLYFSFKNDKNHRPPPSFILSSFGILMLSVFLGIALALYLIFKSIQKKAIMADVVIAELKAGNLKARFPVKKLDEFGQAMTRFNQMADEIERLVEQLKTVERSRMNLLQELAHDLRTPVASLKNLLETLQRKQGAMDVKLQEEFLGLSLKEVDYFHRLVEDLLTLAQVSEPRYHQDRSAVDFKTLFEEELEVLAAKYAPFKKVESRLDAPSGEIRMNGDEHLLRRLIRNVLENAFSFSTRIVGSKIEVIEDELLVQINDDGCGMSEEAIQNFGIRRGTRIQERNVEGRVSIGLGSVIMKTVVEIHGGTLKVKNRTDISGKVMGTQIEIRLPLR